MKELLLTYKETKKDEVSSLDDRTSGYDAASATSKKCILYSIYNDSTSYRKFYYY